MPIDGIAGVGAILYHLFGMPIGLSNILLNVPIVLYCFKLLGRGFFLRSVRCMVMFAFFTDFVLPMLRSTPATDCSPPSAAAWSWALATR